MGLDKFVCMRAARVVWGALVNHGSMAGYKKLFPYREISPFLLRTANPCYRPNKLSRREIWSSPRPQGPGQFGVENLHVPSDFDEITRTTIERSDELVQKICSMPPSLDCLATVDLVSDVLCQAVDLAELCRNVHPSPEWLEAADRCYNQIATYMEKLNTNIEVYHAIARIAENHPLMDTFTEEQVRVVKLLMKDMQLRGIALEESDREQVSDYENTLRNLSTQFARVIFASEEEIPMERGFENHLRDLPYSTQQRIRTQGAGRLMLPNDADAIGSVLRWCTSGKYRKSAYMGAYGTTSSKVQKNLRTLKQLLEIRHALATKVGFTSFADLSIHSNMVESTDAVEHFLQNVARTLRPRALEELSMIQAAKGEAYPGNISNNVYPWDTSFYMGMLKAEAHDLESDSLTAYFPISNVIEGLDIIIDRLFDHSFVRTEMCTSENWTSTISRNDLMRFELRNNKTGNVVGTVYFDIWSRPNKISGAATFVIRSGRALPNGYQTPSCAVVCSFGKPQLGGTACLSHSELQTLFHEMGHVLHQLLARTEYQHLSGTRGPELDFMEIPSTLMENFAWDYRVLRTFARHHRTGETITKDLVERLRKSKHMFSAMETLDTTVLAMVDQALHASQPLGETTTAAHVRIHDKYHVISSAPDTHWHSQFSHLTQYGAGYYSYLYSRVYSSHIWYEKFYHDPLSAEAGRAYLEGILVHGGGKDPKKLLHDYLGGDAKVEYLIADISGTSLPAKM